MMILLGFLLAQDPPVQDLIRSLDDDDITVRRRAAEELYLRGPAVEEALWVAMLRGESLEVVLAAKQLLGRLGKPISRTGTVWGLPVVDDSVRRSGKLKDDPPQVEFDR
jgi:HEAT repeat protein